MDRNLNQDDGVTEQCVNQSGIAENGSEHAACQVKVQEKVVATWLFNTGADANVMPKCVWEQLGEPAQQTTSVTLRGANGQDLGAMGEVQARGFIGKIKVQFTAVVARDARRCLLSGPQLRTKGYTFSLNHRESFLTQPKDGQRTTMSREGNRDTLRSCLSVETKVGNLPDVEA